MELAERPLQPGDAVAADMQKALEGLHHLGFVHLVVKPANFLLKRKGRATQVCLADFGTVLAAQTQVPQFVGTAMFAAPRLHGHTRWPFDRLIRKKLEGPHSARTQFKRTVTERAQGHLSWQWQTLDAVIDGTLAMWEMLARDVTVTTGHVLNGGSNVDWKLTRLKSYQDFDSGARDHDRWRPFVAGVVVGGAISLGYVPAVRAADLVNGEAIFDARRRQVVEGQAPMPSFANLGEKNVEDVASFVYTEAEVNWKDKKLLGGKARRFSQFLDSLLSGP
eukprot:s196_g30.t1